MANDKGDSKEGILASDQLNLKVLGQVLDYIDFSKHNSATFKSAIKNRPKRFFFHENDDPYDTQQQV